jgi:glycolate oxidase iron-sulfur subunit
VRFPEYPRTLDCVHCGLCIPHCPTHGVTGREADSPRGRIYLMRGWAEGALELTKEARAHLDRCIVCRACESVCPSGIRMGEMMESFRAETGGRSEPRSMREGITRFFLRSVLPRRDRIARLSDVLELHQRSGLRRMVDAVLKPVAPGLARLHAMQPDVPPRSVRRVPTDRTVAMHPAQGRRRGRVGLFLGCIASEWFAPLHRATIRTLTRYGLEVVVPDAQTCCGALHRHAGLLEDAAALLDANARAFQAASVDAIVVNAAGCGASLREPIPHASAMPFASPVRDVVEILHELVPAAGLEPVPALATVDQPCHLLHAQRVGPEVVEGLLARIPELRLVPLPGSERCCGAGGIYNLLHPEMSEPILKEKVDAIRTTGAALLVTANPGCAMQIRRGLADAGLAEAIEVVHPVELLERAIPS